MEEIILQTYSALILTLLGFVLPILAIAISFFPEGLRALRDKYENEQKQAENNIKQSVVNKENVLDISLLNKNINELKLLKTKAIIKLFYLNPKNIILRSVLSLGLSLILFLVVVFYLNRFPLPVLYILGLLSILSLLYAFKVFKNSIEIIIEASVIVQEIKSRSEANIVQLISTLVDNTKKDEGSIFADSSKVKICLNKEIIIEGKVFVFSVAKKHSVNVALQNLNDRMLKIVELGFVTPQEVLVEGTSIDSTYVADKEKIIRFTHEYIQAKENMDEGDIELTFLKTGRFELSGFVKAENLKNKKINFIVNVVD